MSIRFDCKNLPAHSKTAKALVDVNVPEQPTVPTADSLPARASQIQDDGGGTQDDLPSNIAQQEDMSTCSAESFELNGVVYCKVTGGGASTRRESTVAYCRITGSTMEAVEELPFSAVAAKVKRRKAENVLPISTTGDYHHGR